MTTRGIIEQVNPCDESTPSPYYTYKVRIPLFHGLSGAADSVPLENLPIAQYPTLPHGEKTKLSVNDVVYVQLVEYNLDDLIIIGLSPASDSFSNSRNTPSAVDLTSVHEIAFASEGIANLPKETTISLENGGTIGKEIFTNISTLSGNVQLQLDLLKGRPEAVIMSQTDFDTASSGTNSSLQPNTLYFIYRTES